MPVVHYDGEIISDSQNIIRVLREKGKIPKEDLSPEIRAHAEMFRLALENFFYWWVDHFNLLRFTYFGKSIPPVLNYIIPTFLIKPNMIKSMYSVGITRHPKHEIWEIFEDFLRNSSVLLGKKKFMFGENAPCVYDLTAYAFFKGTC
jgi:hypothetical protein